MDAARAAEGLVMGRPVFGQDRDPVAAADFRMPRPAERDAQWRRDLAAWARKHPVCACECPECEADGLHEAHPHVPEDDLDGFDVTGEDVQ